MTRDIIVKHIVELLPLASRPTSIKSMDDWHPFPGASLGELVEVANRRCINRVLNEAQWPLEDIRDFAVYLRVVNHDLSTAAKLDRSRFRKIQFLIMDIDDVQGHEDAINQIKLKIAGAAEAGKERLLHHLGQVSRKADVESRFSLFQGLRILPSDPQVLVDEDAFYAWLGGWCTLHYATHDTLLSPPNSAQGLRIPLEHLGFDIALRGDFRKEIPRIASEVRDKALLNNLTVEETQGLALHAGIQEYALLQVKHDVVEMLGFSDISTDFLRVSFEELSTSPTLPEKQPVDLLAIQVTQPWKNLSPEIRRKLSVLGINQKNRSVVVPNNPSVRKNLRSAGSNVRTKEFSSNLPLESGSGGFDF